MSTLGLSEAGAAGVERVGGKAAGLARLAALGLPVPEARVLPAEAHGRWRSAGRLADADRAALAAVAAELGEPLAVRSSAVDEDGAERSAAGQYESVMGVRGAEALCDAVEACYRAADGERARAYFAADRAASAGGAVAVVIQREVASQRAGVGFSADPVSGARDAVLLEVVFGHGEGVVAGAITPDRYRVARDGGGVTVRVAVKAAAADGGGALHPLPPERRAARTLRDDEARAVADMVLAAERGAGAPVDVEFCLAGAELWAVQCRPITTLHG